MGEGVRECVCRPMAGPYIGTLNANMMDEAKGEGADSKRVNSAAARYKHEAYNGTRLMFLANVYKMNVT